MIRLFKLLCGKFLEYRKKKKGEREIRQKKYDEFVKLKKLQEKKKELDRLRSDKSQN